MLRSLMTGVAAVALLTGAAYAQDSGSYYNQHSVTTTTPFGANQTTTTTTAPAMSADEDADVDDVPPPPMAAVPPPPPPGYDRQSAYVGNPPPPPPPSDYERTTTTRQIGPDGSEVRRTDRVQQHQTYYDGDEQLSAHTTTRTQSNTTYGPPVVYAPTVTSAGPSPSLDLPPHRYTTTTTTITHDDE